MKRWLMMAMMLVIVTTSIPIFAKGQIPSHEKGNASSQEYNSQQAQKHGCK